MIYLWLIPLLLLLLFVLILSFKARARKLPDENESRLDQARKQ